MPVHMSGAAFRALHEYLGFTREEFAEFAGVKHKMVAQWDQDRSRVPPGIIDLLLDARARADRLVADLVAEAPEVLYTYGNNEDARAAGISFPAAWHRAVIARVLRELPDSTVEYLRPE